MQATGILTLLCASGFLALIIFLVFHNIAFRNITKKFKHYKRARFGFYECGLRARPQLSVSFTLHSYLICMLTVIYDVEGLFFIMVLLCLGSAPLVVLGFLYSMLYSFLLGISFDESRGVGK